MKIYIYALIDPRTKHIRYIGKSNNYARRYVAHLNSDNRSERGKWINQLLDLSLIPEMFILDEVEENEWQFWEIHYISLYESLGYDLLNITIGGEEVIYRNIHLKEKYKSKEIRSQKEDDIKEMNKLYYNFIKTILRPYKLKIENDLDLCTQLEIFELNKVNEKSNRISKDKYNLIYDFIIKHYNSNISRIFKNYLKTYIK